MWKFQCHGTYEELYKVFTQISQRRKYVFPVPSLSSGSIKTRQAWRHDFLMKSYIFLKVFQWEQVNNVNFCIVQSNILVLCKGMSVLGHHGLFQALCQLSITWFWFVFVSKNELPKKIKNESNENEKSTKRETERKKTEK